MMRSLWLGMGWLAIVAAFGFSLAPTSPHGVYVPHVDKLVHLTGYATLMFWWAQLYTAFQQRVRLGMALVLLGITIEWLQGFTSTRESDAWDVLANTVGILLGGWIAYRSVNLLRIFSHYAVKTGGK